MDYRTRIALSRIHHVRKRYFDQRALLLRESMYLLSEMEVVVGLLRELARSNVKHFQLQTVSGLAGTRGATLGWGTGCSHRFWHPSLQRCEV